MLAEGNETLTLTVNGKKASVAVLDDNTVKIASVVLESDSLGSSAIYKLSDGTIVIAEAGLYDGDTLEDYVPLKASPSTNYAVPKTVAALISYNDGSYGLLSKTGVTYSEQKFTEDGIAKGKPTKLTASQLLAKETEIGKDLDDDGNIGNAIMAVLDEDGDASQEDSGLFQTLTGSLVVASTELMEGDTISDGLVLMMSKTKAFTRKSTQTVLGLAQKESGNWEILIQSGKAISAQKFSDVGIAKGAASKLTAGQLLEKESQTGVDLNGDGIVGDAVAAVLDGDGDPTQQEYGLYRGLSGAVMVARSGLAVGDELFDALVLQASKGKPLSLKPTQTVLGLAQTESNDCEVLIRSGKALSTQAFDAQTGIATGKVVTVKPGDLKSKETQYGLDLDGDGKIGEPNPTDGETLRAGSGVSKVVIQTAGVINLTSGDVGLATTTPSYHQALVLGAAGSPGTTLNIDYGRVDGLNKPLVIGAVSTDRQSTAGKEDDKVLSGNRLPATGVYAGIGNNRQGIVNVDDEEIYFTG